MTPDNIRCQCAVCGEPIYVWQAPFESRYGPSHWSCREVRMQKPVLQEPSVVTKTSRSKQGRVKSKKKAEATGDLFTEEGRYD